MQKIDLGEKSGFYPAPANIICRRRNNMKLQLPNSIIELRMELPIEDRVQYIQSLLEKETVVYRGEKITLDDYFSITAQTYHTIIILDMLAYYITKGYFTRDELLLEQENLTFMKEAKKRHKRSRQIMKLLRNRNTHHRLQDNYVLSHHKLKEMAKGSSRHNTFSGISYFEAISFGIEDVEEDFI